MDVLLQLILAASGLCAFSAHVNDEYHFVNDRKTWTEAQSYCREKYTDLATIDDMEAMKVLNDLTNGSNVVNKYNYVWIGLYNDLTEATWKWSLSDTNFYGDGETEFRNWQPGEPNGHKVEQCTGMYSDGQWSDMGCADRRQAVCMDVRGLDVTFVPISNNMNWSQAQNACRENHTDLASVTNAAENQMVKEQVPAGQYAWIGLFRDSWKWSDGSNSSLRYWNRNQPNDVGTACAAADSRSGRWSDFECSDRTASICYGPPVKQKAQMRKQVIKVRLQRNDSSLDLNDPNVTEQILQQLKQKLKDEGLNEDVRLSWKKQPDGKIFHKEKKEMTKNEEEKEKKEVDCTKKDEL